MKKSCKIYAIFVLFGCLSILLFTQCLNDDNSQMLETNSILDPVLQKGNLTLQGKGNLSDLEKADLLYMREEEKLARDVYNFLYETWGLAIFAKIAISEQNHMDALKHLIDKHKMSDIDPVVIQPEPGLFVNESIQLLYNELVEKGALTQIDAFEVGVIIEGFDIEDLELILTRVDNQDFISVYENILDASYNHLSAFESLLQKVE